MAFIKSTDGCKQSLFGLDITIHFEYRSSKEMDFLYFNLLLEKKGKLQTFAIELESVSECIFHSKVSIKASVVFPSVFLLISKIVQKASLVY